MSCFFLIWNKLILHIRLMIYTQLIYLLLKDTLHIKYICHYWGIYREQLRLTTRHSMSKHEYKYVVLCIDIHFFSSSVELFWLSVRVTTLVGALFEKIDWGNLGTSSSSPFMQKEGSCSCNLLFKWHFPFLCNVVHRYRALKLLTLI